MPSFGELLYLANLLDRGYAYECVRRRMNTGLNAIELGESNLRVLISLFLATSLSRWSGGNGNLAVGRRGGTLSVRDWGLQ